MASIDPKTRFVLKINKEVCRHSPERRTFDIFSTDAVFSDLHAQFGGPACDLEIYFGANDNGPWCQVNSDLHPSKIFDLMDEFPGTKYVRLVCVSRDHVEPSTTEIPKPEASKSAFDVLMGQRQKKRSLPDKRTSSAGVPDGISRKDELYNNLLNWMEGRGMLVENQSEGSYITQISESDMVLTNTLWYITNQHTVINERSQRDKGVKPIPVAFQEFQGYNEHRRKKMKSQPLESTQLKNHADTLMSICIRPIMNSTPAWELACVEIKSLVECLLSYHVNLLETNERNLKKQNLDHPARQVSEDTSVWTAHKTAFGVQSKYSALDKAMLLSELHETVFFNEELHLNNQFENGMQRYRFQLSVTVDIFKYCPGGGVTNLYCLVKVPDSRSEADKLTQVASVMAKIKPKLPEYHTRSMKRIFKQRINNIVSIKPAIADLLYKELTLDNSSVNNPVMQQRLRLIFMGETSLIADLRQMNTGRPDGTFDVFFKKLEELVEEYTAADERRHNIAHMSQFLSMKDLIAQTTERCPEDAPIPSAALVHLSFTPRNPYSHTALSFTSKIKVQYKIQRRQLRLSHIDDHYCNTLFKYLRCLAVKLRDECQFFCCDDKAKVPIGQPNVAISTGVRGKKTLAPVTTTIGATDHDLHHQGSLTPSVALRCAIPEDMNGSFYRGTVTTVINDSVFQASNPMRHATTLVRQVKELDNRPSVILKYSDGGTDHRNNLESVKCAAICIFKELNLDLYVAARCSPGNSWINPCERVMSILNVGLQNCTLSRVECNAETEKVLKSCSSMDSIRKVAHSKDGIEVEWTQSVLPVQKVIEKRFQRLALKDEPVQVRSPVGTDEIDVLRRHLTDLFPDLNLSKLIKVHTSKVASYVTWVERHCHQRQYVLQIQKCADTDCCSAPKTAHEWLPDPMLDASGEHFKAFDEVYGSETTEQDRPSRKPVMVVNKSKEKTAATAYVTRPSATCTLENIVPDDPLIKGNTYLFTAQHARSTVACVECNKPRVIYCKTKLPAHESVHLTNLLSEYDYSCGAPITPPNHPLHGKALVRLNLECSSPIETPYYSGSVARPDICFHCGAPDSQVDVSLKKEFKTVLPMCPSCAEKGLAQPCFRPYGKKRKV